MKHSADFTNWTVEEKQDDLMNMIAEGIKYEAPTQIYESAVKIQELGDMDEARFNRFSQLIEDAQEKGLLGQ
jgi:hypothetical protein